MTTIEAKSDLYNGGRCFTKGQTYQVKKDVRNEPGLMEAETVNDLGEPHVIGSWWREFKIVKNGKA